MKITAKRLRELKIGEDQVRVFEKEWPDGMEVTEANCLRIVEIGFDIDWMVEDLLSPAAYAKHVKLIDAAWEEYLQITDAAGEEYLQIMDAAWEDFDKAATLALWQAAK